MPKPDVGFTRKAKTNAVDIPFNETHQLVEGQEIDIALDGTSLFTYTVPVKKGAKLSVGLNLYENDASEFPEPEV